MYVFLDILDENIIKKGWLNLSRLSYFYNGIFKEFIREEFFSIIQRIVFKFNTCVYEPSQNNSVCVFSFEWNIINHTQYFFCNSVFLWTGVILMI